jgi:hypothetical protein
VSVHDSRAVLVAAGLALGLPALLSRCFFLAPYRAGALFYYANIWKELFARRKGWPHAAGDLVPLALGVVMCGAAGARSAALGLLAAVAVLEAVLAAAERRVLTGSGAPPDPRWHPPGASPGSFPAGAAPHPSHHPALVVNLVGPFASRVPRYDLGDLVSGRTLLLRVLVGNHSIVPAQVPVELSVASDGPVAARLRGPGALPPPRSGDVRVFEIEVTAAEGTGPRGRIALTVSCGPDRQRVPVFFSGVCPPSPVAAALVSRYPGARRAAFAWRGDMDHYDTVSFQSIEGLRTTLGLAARYRVPQTMFLSTRLTLDADETTAFYRHFGGERGAEEVPAFVGWLRENADLRHTAPYPFEPGRPFVLELGNHMHLHYGTDAAAAPENGWKRGARMGDGRYAWSVPGADSFTEQRDNAREAARRQEEAFGFRPRSWAMPDSTKDEHTPKAVAAAGCDVLSDSVGGSSANVIRQPAPFVPEGTSAVELTKRFPGDPESLTQAKMFLYWAHRARRRGIPVLFMCHQHMRQFAGTACTRLTEYVIREALTAFNGDLFVDTVWGVGSYWLAALGPRAAVHVEVEGGVAVVRNGSDRHLSAVPVDLVLASGRRSTVLVDLPAGAVVQVGAEGARA